MIRILLNIQCCACLVLALGRTALCAPDAAPAQGGPATTSPSAPTVHDVQADLNQTVAQIHQIIGTLDVMADATQRASIAPQAIPLLKTVVADLGTLEEMRPALQPRIAAPLQQYTAFLLTFGDKETVERINAQSTGKDALLAIEAKATEVESHWYLAGRDGDAQTKVVNEIQKLDTRHPDSDSLTALTFRMSRSASSKALFDRLQDIVKNTMTSTVAAEISKSLAAANAAAEKKSSNENKPLVIAGKTVDGKAFTTADWKGKVVLVDFWATWCVPCRRELPRVEKAYSQFHGKGLEIVGVSNDFDADALRKFVASEPMPWPQLFDPSAASQQNWNPVTLGLGVEGIPAMFLIDKKGVCRTVAAGENLEDMIPRLLAE